MFNKASRLILGCALVLGPATPASPDWTIVRVAHSEMPIPGGAPGENFSRFGSPAMHAGILAFFGQGSAQAGIFTWEGGAFAIIADVSTPIPDRQGVPIGEDISFTDFAAPSIDSGKVRFWGQYAPIPTQEGIYIFGDGPLRAVADRHTDIPNDDGVFVFFDRLEARTLDNGDVTFGASYIFEQQDGIYAELNGTLKVIADRQTSIPGSADVFEELTNTSIDNKEIVLVGRNPARQSFLYRYRDSDGLLTIEVDDTTVIPGGRDTFAEVREASINGGDICFIGGIPTGVYTKKDGVIAVVADTSTIIPGADAPFQEFGNPAIDDGFVAFYVFRAGVPNYEGIFSDYGGTLTNIIDTNAALDGKKILSLTFTGAGLHGNQLAFRAIFDDLSEAIYLATSDFFFTLTLTIVGDGTGSVVLDPPGNTCTGTCQELYEENTEVILTVRASQDSYFVGWTGDPDCSDSAVLMDSAKACTANFCVDFDQDDVCADDDCDDADPTNTSPACVIFVDGFELGDTSAWNQTVP